MTLGDIRGEEIPTLERPMSAEEALLGAAGATLGLGAAVAGPWATLGMMYGVGHVLTVGTKWAGAGAMWAGSQSLPYVRGAGRYAKNALEISLAAVRREGFWENGMGRLASAGSAALVAGRAGLAAAGSGLGVAGAGLRGVADLGRLAAPFATMGAVAAGAALGAYQAHRDAEREAFIASSNAYMARGAANRNRSQGRY